MLSDTEKQTDRKKYIYTFLLSFHDVVSNQNSPELQKGYFL